MTPYYQTENATLYHGDAREILDTLPPDSVDLLATDPPYALKQAIRPLRKSRHVYVFGYSPNELAEPLQLGGTTDIVWNKSLIGPGDLSSPWAPQHERITFGVHIDSHANRADGPHQPIRNHLTPWTNQQIMCALCAYDTLNV